MDASRTQARPVTSGAERLAGLQADDQKRDRPLAPEVQYLEVDAESAKTRDRSAIARWVVIAFLVVVIGVLAFALLGALYKEWDAVKLPAEYAVGTISSVLLPVVTLVLGYYFGTGDNSA